MGNVFDKKTSSPKLQDAWSKFQKERPRVPKQAEAEIDEIEKLLREAKYEVKREDLKTALDGQQKLEAFLKRNSPSMTEKDKPTPVYVVWDKEKMSRTYDAVLEQLLRAIDCTKMETQVSDGNKMEKLSTLYICRTSTGRLEDIDKQKLQATSDPKALIVLRCGKNEDVFPSTYSAREIVGEETLVIQLLHYEGKLNDGKLNTKGYEELKKFTA